MTDSFPLFDVPKQCACGNQWVGKSLKPLAVDETLPRPGTCDTCLAATDARNAAQQRKATPRPDITLEPPQRVRKDWE